jgi:hypothetical protein
MRSTGATTCTMVNRTSSIVPERCGIASAAVCGSHLVTARVHSYLVALGGAVIVLLSNS